MRKIIITLWAVILTASAIAQSNPAEIVTLRSQIETTNLFTLDNPQTLTYARKEYRVPTGKVLMITDISAAFDGLATNASGGVPPGPIQTVYTGLHVHAATGTNELRMTFFNCGYGSAANVHFSTPIPVYAGCYLYHELHGSGIVLVRGYLTIP